MKRYLFLITSILLAGVAAAQRDTTRRDTSWGTSPHGPYLRAVLNADVLEGRAIPVTITPTGQKLCFDKKIKVKMITRRGPGEICVFINTKSGLIGYNSFKPGSTGVCDIKPDLPDFVFGVIGLKGNVFNYRNTKKKNTIEHWVQTSNSVEYQYQFSAATTNVLLHKKTERRDYCDGKIKAQLYKADGSSQQWFLFGKEFPEALMMEPKKYLGNFAVGYQQSDKGLFIIMQMIGGSMDSKILEIEDVEICFDPAPFKIFEDERRTKMTASIAREREKIARDEAKPEKYAACNSKKTTIISFKKEALNRQEENLNRSEQGNMMQSVPTQQAQADLMNYDDMIQISIYETELKLCRAEQRQAENPSESTQKNIECLNRQLAAQHNVKARYQTLNTSLRNQPGQLFAEKAKLFMQALVGCD
ncbi:MAG: hypothetical protein ABL872_04295 [Lacibacter sp.]